MDASPILLSNNNAVGIAHQQLRTEVLTLYDQCLFLPEEVARVMRHHLNQTCLDHGSSSLSQLQQVVRFSDQVDHDSVIALLLRRLDEQGLEISSPWALLPCLTLAEPHFLYRN